MSDFGLSEEDINAINGRIDAQAQDAYQFAQESPEADLDSLYDYVYAP